MYPPMIYCPYLLAKELRLNGYRSLDIMVADALFPYNLEFIKKHLCCGSRLDLEYNNPYVSSPFITLSMQSSSL